MTIISPMRSTSLRERKSIDPFFKNGKFLNHMNRSVLFILTGIFLLASAPHANAQKRKNKNDTIAYYWYPGTLNLLDGQTLSGELSLEYFRELIGIRKDSASMIQFFGKRQIDSFALNKWDGTENYKVLDLGDGLRFYKVIGENSEIAFLAYYDREVVGKYSLPSGTSAGNPSSSFTLPNSDVVVPMHQTGISSGVSSQKEIIFTHFLAITSTGERYKFNRPRNMKITGFERDSYVRSKEAIEFLERLTPGIKKYIRKHSVKLNDPDHLELILVEVLDRMNH